MRIGLTSLLKTVLHEKTLHKKFLVEDDDAIPGDVPGEDQAHVFDFDDTLGLTSNANGIMVYLNGEPAHKSKEQVKAWMKEKGISDSYLLEPGIVEIPERKGWALYVSSAGLAKIQKEYPADQQAVTGKSEPLATGESILIDFTPSSGTDVKTTKAIDSTITKLKQANAQGSDTIVITARSSSGKGKNFAGKDVEATNAKDMEDFLAAQGAKPNKGVLGVSGQDKGKAIINTFMTGEDPPEEIHFYDDLKKNTDQVKAAIANKVPAELFIYGPGEFAHNEADPNKPDEKFSAAVKEIRKRLNTELKTRRKIKMSEFKRIVREVVKTIR